MESQCPRLFLTSSSGPCPSVYSLSRHCPGPALSSSATGHAVPIAGRGPGKRRAARGCRGLRRVPRRTGAASCRRGSDTRRPCPEGLDVIRGSRASHGITQGPGPAAGARVLALPGTQLLFPLPGSCGGAAGRCPMDVLWQCPGDMRARLGRLLPHGVSPLRPPQTSPTPPPGTSTMAHAPCFVCLVTY